MLHDRWSHARRRGTQNFLVTSLLWSHRVLCALYSRSSPEAGSIMSGVASTLAKKRARAAGFGTNANANKYLNQDYEGLRSQSQAQGKLFCDPYFPAAPESLGFRELGPNSSKTRGVQWKRPGVSNAQQLGRRMLNADDAGDLTTCKLVGFFWRKKKNSIQTY